MRTARGSGFRAKVARVALCRGAPPVAGMLVAWMLVAARVLAASPPTGTVPTYRVHVTQDSATHAVRVEAEVTLPPTDSVRDRVEVLVSRLYTDVAATARVDGTGIPVALAPRDTEAGQVRWAISFPRAVPARRAVTVTLSYGGGLGAQTVYYVGKEATFAGSNTAWYPQLPDARGTRAKGTGTLTFDVSGGLEVVATGRAVGDSAATSRGHFEFRVDRPTSFSFVIGRYVVLRRPGRTPVSVHLLRARPDAGAYADGLQHVIAVLEAEFGPFPYPEFQLVEVPSAQAGQAAFSGASAEGFMLADDLSFDAPFNLAFFGHEVGHQWWGNAITVSGQRGLFMLSEGMAQYGSLRVVTRLLGEDAAMRYRRDGFPGYNWSQDARGYLRLAAAGFDEPLESLHGANAHALANSKGFLVLDLLRRLIGERTFGERMHAFVGRHLFSAVTWDAFLGEIGRGSPDVARFGAGWLSGTGAPRLEVRWTRAAARGVDITVEEPDLSFLAPVDVFVLGHTARSTDTIRTSVVVRDGRGRTRVRAAFDVDSVVVDPYYRVLRWTPALARDAEALRPFTRGVALESMGARPAAAASYTAGLDSLRVPDAAGAEFLFHYALGGLAMGERRWGDARRELEAALRAPERPVQRLASAYLRLAQVAQSMGDSAQAARAAAAAITADAAVGGTWISAFARGMLRANP